MPEVSTHSRLHAYSWAPTKLHFWMLVHHNSTGWRQHRSVCGISSCSFAHHTGDMISYGSAMPVNPDGKDQLRRQMDSYLHNVWVAHAYHHAGFLIKRTHQLIGKLQTAVVRHPVCRTH